MFNWNFNICVAVFQYLKNEDQKLATTKIIFQNWTTCDKKEKWTTMEEPIILSVTNINKTAFGKT